MAEINEVKRPLYFTSQLLVEGDFHAEQSYHRDLRHLHNISLHTFGVVRGLQVTKAGSSVEVSEGMALDNQGREIVISTPQNPQTLDLSSITPGTSVFITIAFEEITLDEDLYTGVGVPGQFTRITLRPLLEAVPTAPDDGSVIKLALVNVEANDLIIDQSVRPLASSLIARESDAEFGNLTVTKSLKVSANANVGIGTTNPTAKLDVVGNAKLTGNLDVGGKIGIGTTGSAFPLSFSSTNGDKISLNSGNGTHHGFGVQTNLLQIHTDKDVSDIAFGAGTSAEFSEVMRIKGNGNVGIGILNPTLSLHVKGRIATGQNMNSAGAVTFFPPDGFAFFHIDNGPAGGRPLGRLRISGGNNPGDVEYINVLQDGRVGIGTPEPDRHLTLFRAGALSGIYANVKNSNHEILVGIDSDAIVSAMTASNLHLRTNNLTRMVIAANTGDIGIGASNPYTKLTLNGSLGFTNATTPMIFMFQSGTDNPDRPILSHSPTFPTWGLSYRDTGDKMIFQSGGTAVMTVSLGGLRVGINNDNPTQALDVTGNINASGNIIGHGVKGGYVGDQFVNKLGETLDQGDVVVIADNQSSLYYGLNNNIPIPEVDLAQSAYDTRVCGIVVQVYAELASEDAQTKKASAKKRKTTQAKVTGRRTKAELRRPRAFSDEELKEMDDTKVGPDQIGWMVTLGAFAHCKVDADIAPIKIGDLLTTSPTKGHAQKVLDANQATGAIIGKALGSRRRGKGKIPVMVFLQ